jgi:hypothetical protein
MYGNREGWLRGELQNFSEGTGGWEVHVGGRLSAGSPGEVICIWVVLFAISGDAALVSLNYDLKTSLPFNLTSSPKCPAFLTWTPFHIFFA